MKIQATGFKRTGFKPTISGIIKKDNGAANNVVKFARKENPTTAQYGGQDGDTTGKKSPKIGISDNFGSSPAVNY